MTRALVEATTRFRTLFRDWDKLHHPLREHRLASGNRGSSSTIASLAKRTYGLIEHCAIGRIAADGCQTY